MEDIGNLVYYILIFVVAIISWISSSTKKKQQHQTTTPPLFPAQDMATTTMPPTVPKKKKGPPPVPKHTWRDSYATSGLPPKYKENTQVIIEEGPSVIDELELNNTESFRKAIIYSEIFNRKEW